MRTWVAAVVVAVCLGMVGVGAVAVAVAAAQQHPPPPGVPTSTEAGLDLVTTRRAPQASRGDRVSGDRVSGLRLASSPPVRLTIPRIGVRTDLTALGLSRDGTLEVPRDGSMAGWYTGAPTPGALGPAVVAGHVTWKAAPAVFFRLGELRRGDRVQVLRRDGSTAVFTVRRTIRVRKDRFPTEQVYGPTDRAALRLITCGGRFDDETGSFLDNVVVLAELTNVSGR